MLHRFIRREGVRNAVFAGGGMFDLNDVLNFDSGDIDSMDDDAGDTDEPTPIGHWTATSSHDVYMVDTPKGSDNKGLSPYLSVVLITLLHLIRSASSAVFSFRFCFFRLHAVAMASWPSQVHLWAKKASSRKQRYEAIIRIRHTQIQGRRTPPMFHRKVCSESILELFPASNCVFGKALTENRDATRTVAGLRTKVRRARQSMPDSKAHDKIRKNRPLRITGTIHPT